MKTPSWRCHECGAGGEVESRDAASRAWERHWNAEHQEVLW